MCEQKFAVTVVLFVLVRQFDFDFTLFPMFIIGFLIAAVSLSNGFYLGALLFLNSLYPLITIYISHGFHV